MLMIVPVEDASRDEEETKCVLRTSEDLGRAAVHWVSPLTGVHVTREQSFIQREATGELQFLFIQNEDSIHTSKLLIDIKNVYSRQLPNMPRDYICKLVLDKSHRSVVVLKGGKTMIGGITYRIFGHQNFAEIAFCAVEGLEQVQGVGTRLMNYCKSYARKYDKIEKLLTYADNNAIGYFEKQGFVKRVLPSRKKTQFQKTTTMIKDEASSHINGQSSSTLAKSKCDLILTPSHWAGYIKDYEGGTLMECDIVPHAPYLHCSRTFKKHKEALEHRLMQKSNSHLIYEGMSFPIPRKRQRVNPGLIPGVKEAGWTPDQLIRNLHFKIDGFWEVFNRESLYQFLNNVLSFIKLQPEAEPFLKPVTVEQAADYSVIIKHPIDISRIEEKLEVGKAYFDLETFKLDFALMFANCRLYNRADTHYSKFATKLEQTFHKYLNENAKIF
eukprot:g7665.t1